MPEKINTLLLFFWSGWKKMKAKHLDLALGILAGALVVFSVGYLVGRSSTRDLVAIRMAAAPTVELPEQTAPAPDPDETAGPVDLNSADAETLASLPGIGETLAKRIVRYREETGGFTSPEEVRDVYGISDSIYETIRPYITVN